MPFISRRRFVHASLTGFGAVYVTTLLPGCSGDDDEQSLSEGSFEHGVASGDPLSDSVILWTRVTPISGLPEALKVQWEIATDSTFNTVVARESGDAKLAADYTVKVDVRGLDANTQYYYRFKTATATSTIGKTRTLPALTAASLKLAIVSCSNYPAGYFHVYDAIATRDFDLILHLGDYIYEYGSDGYASERAEELGRVVEPTNELLTLTDYRTRYAQYRSDAALQRAHASAPFLVVWDDHEVANDAWQNGAENHSDDEGSFQDRKLAALRAYFEWLPIRPLDALTNEDLITPSSIYRQFEWGDLVNILMLDTRHEARAQPLELTQFFDPTSNAFDFETLFSSINNPDRQLLGSAQESWLANVLASSSATWQLLGQQILMGRMILPFAIATQQMSIPQYAMLGQLAALAGRAQQNDPTLTTEELSYLAENQALLTPDVLTLLQAPGIPYNLDAWDGFAAARERVLEMAKQANANLVVLAGDTHNAWASEISDADGTKVAVELATPSVSSPGLEAYLGVAAEDYTAVEAGIVSLVEELRYMNTGDRGYLDLDINHERIIARWEYVSTIFEPEYSLLSSRTKQLRLDVGSKTLAEI